MRRVDDCGGLVGVRRLVGGDLVLRTAGAAAGAADAAEEGRCEVTIIEEVLAEVHRARDKFPNWPNDPLHAAAIVAEECGELQRAVLTYMYEPWKWSTPDDVRDEAIQTAAMCIRFLTSYDKYVWNQSTQHGQANGAEGGAQ